MYFLFFVFVFVILYSRPIGFYHALLEHIVCVLVNKLLVTFCFKLIDNFVTPMEGAYVVDQIPS